MPAHVVAHGHSLETGGIAVRERQIQLRKIVENCRGNCGEIAGKLRDTNCGVTKPPEDSMSNTSAQGTHRAPTSTQSGQAKPSCRKSAGNCGKLREIAKLGEIAEYYGPQSPPSLLRTSSEPPGPGKQRNKLMWLSGRSTCHVTGRRRVQGGTPHREGARESNSPRVSYASTKPASEHCPLVADGSDLQRQCPSSS